MELAKVLVAIVATANLPKAAMAQQLAATEMI